MKPISQKMTVNGICECGKVVEIKDIQTPVVTVPSSSWPYAQKLFSVKNKFGITTFGAGFINNRSIYNHFIELNPKLPDPSGENRLDALSRQIGEYFQSQLKIEMQNTGVDIGLMSDDWMALGFQLVGFNQTPGNTELLAQTRFIKVGKKIAYETQQGIGCSVTGDLRVVDLLWKGQGPAANYGAFSLQDAIDYAKFLIRTTADFQRFSGELPTVGGEIDIALITNHRGFQWISQKELFKRKEGLWFVIFKITKFIFILE